MGSLKKIVEETNRMIQAQEDAMNNKANSDGQNMEECGEQQVNEIFGLFKNKAEKAYEYAEKNNFKNIPQEIIVAIATSPEYSKKYSDAVRARYESVPSEIANAIKKHGSSMLGDLINNTGNEPQRYPKIPLSKSSTPSYA